MAKETLKQVRPATFRIGHSQILTTVCPYCHELHELQDMPMDSIYSTETQKAEIEAVFSYYGNITDPAIKTKYLIKAKGLLSPCSQEVVQLSPQDKYEHELELFITGEDWALKKPYSNIQL